MYGDLFDDQGEKGTLLKARYAGVGSPIGLTSVCLLQE